MKTKGLTLVLIISILLLIISCNDKKTTEPKPKVAVPTFNPPGGMYEELQEVTISCVTEAASIRYTTDGSTPTESATLYVNPVEITETSTLKAKGFKKGWEKSESATAEYVILTEQVLPVVFYPPGGNYTSHQIVEITCDTEGAVIRYTTDGNVPTDSSSIYVEPILLSETTILTARASKDGMISSNTTTSEYIITLPSIVRIELYPIPDFLPLESVFAIQARAYYEDQNPVTDGTMVLFDATKGFFEENNIGYTVNGIASVFWNTGTSSGNVTLRAMIRDVVSEVYSSLVPGPAARIMLSIDNDSVDLGDGIWRIQVRATVRDIFDNSVLTGTVVHFSLGDDPSPPEGTHIVAAAYAGNPGDNFPEGLEGVAFVYLTYHGSYSNLPIRIIAESGDIRDSSVFILP